MICLCLFPIFQKKFFIICFFGYQPHADCFFVILLCYTKIWNSRIIARRHVLSNVRVNKTALSVYDDKRCILSGGISTLPYGHYRALSASVFPDGTDSNRNDDDTKGNKINRASYHEFEDIEACLNFFEEKMKWLTAIQRTRTNKKSSYKLNYPSEDSSPKTDTQPSQSLRDLLSSTETMKLHMQIELVG